MNFKRFWAAAAAIAAAAGMAACAGGTGNGGGFLTEQNDRMGYCSVTSARLLAQTTDAIGRTALLLTAEAANGTTESEEGRAVTDSAEEPNEAELNAFNRYLNLLDDWLGGDGIRTEVTESDREDFARKMMVGGITAEGAPTTYTLYYNETGSDSDSEDEAETETAFEGVLVLGEREYPVIGKQETEEGESELEVRAELDANRYAVVKQEIEADETEYVYTVFRDGVPTERTKVEFERDDEQTEIELTFLEGAARGAYRLERDDETGIVRVRARDASGSSEFRAIPVTDANGNKAYRYEFGDCVRELERDDD